MMKQSTSFAQVATNLLNVLQGYTKGIRFVVVLTMLLSIGVGKAWADYTITFKTSGNNNDGSQAQTTIANLISSGGGYVSTISATKAYNGKNGYGVKLGSSSDVGNVSMNLTSNGNNIGQIKASKLIVNAAYYKTGPKLKVTVTYTDNTTVSQSLSLTASIAAYDVTLSSTKTLKSITIESVAGSSEERVYCHSIQVVAAAAVSTYTVTYDLNGGTGTTPTQAKVAAGGTFILAASSGFSNVGYSFAGWNDGTKTYNAGDTYTMPANAVTLKAQWVALSKYTVTWDVNGDQSVTTQVTEGSKPTFPATPSSCDATSNTFYGWATATWDGKIDNISEKTIYTSANNMPVVNGAVTYYAVFATKGAGGGTAFDGTSGGDFKIYALVEGEKKYLSGTGSKISPVDEAEATEYTFTKISDGVFSIKTGTTYLTYASSTNLGTSNSSYSWNISEGTNGSWRIASADDSSRGIVYRASTYNQFGGYATSNIKADGTEYYDVEIGGGASVSYSGYITSCTAETTHYLLRK